MTPTSHKGARRVWRDAGDRAGPNLAATSYVPALTSAPAASVMALASRSANQALSRQIEIAFDVGQALRAQSRDLERTARTAVPAGPWRETLMGMARAQARFADTVVDQALALGRRYGGLAFAYPLPGRAG